MNSINQPGPAQFNGSLVLNCVTDVTDHPVWVRVELFQNEQMVYTNVTHEVPTVTFSPLASQSYVGGAASGTATLFYTDKHGNSHTLATCPVTVGT